MIHEVGQKLCEKVPCARVLGVPVHLADFKDVTQRMEEWIERRDRCHWIAVTSSHGIVEAHKHPDFRAILETADLSLPDGKWTAYFASRLASCPPRRIRGADLLVEVCRWSTPKGYSHFFYGDTNEVLLLMTSKLWERFPELRVAGALSPPFREMSTEEELDFVEAINRVRPDILWVGLGVPKQERWIVNHLEKLNVPVIVGVGAAFKFVSGKIKPAPAWVSNLGFEWGWRFLREPRRVWHRAFVYGPQFMAHGFLQLSRLKKSRPRKPA